jgi:hypothetical protein
MKGTVMDRTLKHELWLLQKKLPKAWEYIQDNYGCCPPAIDDLAEDEREMVCYGGCKLCWNQYYKDEFRSIL